ncbi:MAG TPA: TSUP family transporter [Rhizomicrobium sp.]|nr:TSUP family transporter [Rhizomicrobium sp.]
MLLLVLLFFASMWAGVQNALAGGGSFITLPSLMLTGMDARAANITSTIALFPAQVAMGLTGRNNISGAEGVSFAVLAGVSLVGGALGALLLLITPSSVFAHMVPWLVLFATTMFAWGSFGPKREGAGHLHPALTIAAQFGIAIYGGYFGGGIGFLMLAALTAAGLLVKKAGATKNMLAAMMNASAVMIFVFSPQVRWMQAGVSCAGAVIGGVAGAHMLNRVNDRLLRIVIVGIGIALTIGLFLEAR